MKSMWPTFKTEMLIYDSKANFDENILLVKSFKTQKSGKFCKGACLGMRIPHSIRSITYSY